MSVRLDRRGFFRQSASLAAVAGGFQALHAAQKPGAQPKNIVWMVADGMSPSVLPLAEHFSKIVRGRGVVWQALMDRPEPARGVMDMASLDSLVTDSSAASSSWGSGSRIFNGMVNMLPDGTKLTPIGMVARDQRHRVGLVTTATVTHATPAGFVAVERNRDNEDGIAEQYLNKADVILGGGARFFHPKRRRDGKDMIAAYRAAGYAYADSRDALKAMEPSAKMLGIFWDSHLPYTVDWREDATIQNKVPSIAEMTQKALDSLSASPSGFLLQVEGARVDHAAHANDAAALLWDQLAFDDAIQVVLQFAEKHPDTLVVITSDHGNSNPGLVGMGTEYRQSTQCFERLAKAKCSHEIAAARAGGGVKYNGTKEAQVELTEAASADRIRETFSAMYSIKPTDDEVRKLQAAMKGQKGLCLNRQLDNLVGVLGQITGNYTGIGWTGTTHTSDYTLVTALGPGAEHFAGYIKNTEVFPALTSLMGAKIHNPSMEPQKAQVFREVAWIPRQRPDWA